MEEKYLQVIRQSPLFQNLDEEQIRNVLQEGFSSVRVFGKGERVFSESDSCRRDSVPFAFSARVSGCFPSRTGRIRSGSFSPAR